MRPSHAPFDRLLKTASASVLGLLSPCDVPQGYASVITLPADLAHAVLTSLRYQFAGAPGSPQSSTYLEGTPPVMALPAV